MILVIGLNASYDYIIVGGGTAGLTIATRLAQNGSLSVAVVEAGSFYELGNGNRSQIPYEDGDSSGTSPDLEGVNSLIDWSFVTTPQTAFSNRSIHYARGKCLGGSSARNYMVYQRPTVGTFAKWADEVGDRSWEWDNVNPYYEKSAHYTPPNNFLRAANSSLGTANETASFSTDGGPLHVSLPNYAQPWSSFFPRAFEELGVPNLKQGTNTGVLHGYAYFTLTEDPAFETRSSSETSFLQQALTETEIVVYTNALAKQILFNADKRANAVLVEIAGMSFQLNATKEIILSAGAFQSPQLLMVSGIGPSSTLERHGIPIIADRPGVGQNLWATLSYQVNVETTSVFSNDPQRILVETENYITKKTGLLTSNGADIVGFLKVTNQSWANMSSTTAHDFQTTFPADWPEIEIASFAIGPNDGVHNFASMAIGLLATFSRGNVTINSSNTADAPIINPAFLTHPHDLTLAITAFKLARHLASTSSLRLAILEEVIPGPAVTTDAEIIAYLKQSVATFYHASCTCKMGRRNDSMAVVDSKARVIGVTGLRVVDASVFPFLVPGQPQATIYMLAEKIAEVVLGGCLGSGSV
ncbi:putative choline dehydrogenase [Aureobasidium pullulans]|uniref:Putative choline dehydrogenase n=2 Tax=Aureobasidium pullulans TaxID=5580 RepID=A0A4S9WGA8_AURPU|nr:putative choline dehydrogenase [Aureobasidium pullulans]